MIPIPEDVQIHINEFSKERHPVDNKKRLAHIQGMEAGYNLAAPLLEEKEREIERLKGLIEKEIGHTYTSNFWVKFKTENNL